LVGVSVLGFLATYLELLGQVDDQRKVLKSVLVYSSHRVVDEIRAKKKSEQENPGVMVLVFIEGSNTLRVDDEHLVLLLSFTHCDWLVPNPETLTKIK